MLLFEWFDKWGVPKEAADDLLNKIGMSHGETVEKLGEADVQQYVRIEASKKGCILWRNNSGVTENHVRYGLANDSAKVNKNIKSSDLIGMRPVIITQDMVGRKAGIFLARECKKGGWHYIESDKRAYAQLKYILLVLAMGGDAAFTDSVGSI